jgi:hypothetical protein
MTTKDPLDDLIARAFHQDFEATSPPAVAGKVMARIRARQRIRGALLAVASVAGLTVMTSNLAPAVQRLLTGLPDIDLSNPALVAVLLALGVVSMLVLAEESL